MMFAIHTIPGTERIAWLEVAERVTGAEQVARRLVPGRNGVLLVRSPGPARELLALRCAEDVFAVAVRGFDILAGREGLRQIFAATRAARYARAALQARADVQAALPAHRTYRVVARTVGQHQFLRRDLGYAVGDAVAQGWPGHWEWTEEDADVEIWATLLGAELLVAVRLSTASMRHRGRAVELPAALRPALAACLVRLTRPCPADRVLDPVAGTGTILLERAAAGPYAALIAGDRAAEAVAALRQNLRGLAHVQVHAWDATSLPLADGEVDVYVANLPFGRQIAAGADLERLYLALLREGRRVLGPGARMALLGVPGALERALQTLRLRIRERYDVQVLGYPALLAAIQL